MRRALLLLTPALLFAGCAAPATAPAAPPASVQARNTQLARKLYADFLRGDIDAVLAGMSDDVVWIIPGSAALPYAGERHGKAEWMAYLKGLGAAEILGFEPREFLADQDKVVVLGHERLKVKATGKVFEGDWAQVLTYRDGKVVRFESYDDTAAAEAGFTAPR